MTPIEKIIVKHYCANSFMFNSRKDEYYVAEAKQTGLSSVKQAILLEQNLVLSVDQIKRKWKDLRDTFVKADKKTIGKKTFSYYENSIYQRLYFLKPFINHEGHTTGVTEKLKSIKRTTTDAKVSNYEKENGHIHKRIEDGVLDETDKYLINTKRNSFNDAAEILNGIIQQYADKNDQILCLKFILQFINEFQSMSIDEL